MGILSLTLKIAQKPCITWSLGPKAFFYESSEPKGFGSKHLLRKSAFEPFFRQPASMLRETTSIQRSQGLGFRA